MDMAIVLGTYTSSPSYTGLDPTVEGAWMVDEREERNDRFFMTELSQEEPTAEIPRALDSVNTALQEFSNGDDHSWVAQAKNPRQEIEALIGVFPQRLTQGVDNRMFLADGDPPDTEASSSEAVIFPLVVTPSLPSYRHTSALFRSLPWHTNILLGPDQSMKDFREKERTFDRLVAAILEFEERMMKPSSDMQQKVFHEFMGGVGQEETNIPQASKGFIPQGRASTIEAIFSHRVLDVACFLYKDPPLQISNHSTVLSGTLKSNEIRNSLASFKKSVCGKFGSHNWVSVVQNSADTLKSMWAESASATGSVAQKESFGAQLFRSVMRTNNLAKGHSILANLEMASLHLHVLIMNGQIKSPSMLEIARVVGVELPDSERRQFEGTYKKAEFERTLFIALAGSPLMLLYDTLLYKKNISKVALFEIFASHEIQTSLEFQRASRALWRALFARALGKPLKDCLDNFFKEASVDPLLPASDAHLFFPTLSGHLDTGGKNVQGSSSNTLTKSGGKKRPPETLSSPPKTKRLKIIENDNGTNLDVAMKEVSLADGDPPDPMAVVEPILNAAEIKSQPRSPQWKGNGKEVSMNVDFSNSDDEEMSSHLSSSEGREASMKPSSSEGGEVSMDLSSSEEKVILLPQESTQQMQNPTATNPLPNSPEVQKPPQAAKAVRAAIKKTPDANLDRSSQWLQHTKLRKREPTTDPVKAGKTSKSPAPGGKRKPAVASVHTQGRSTSRKIGPPPFSSRSVVVKQESVEYEACHQDLMSWSKPTLSQDVGKPRYKGDTSVKFSIPGSVGEHITYTPEAHFDSELAWFYELAQRLDAPETSCVKEVSLVEWSGLNDAAKQELLKSKDVLVYDPEAKGISFNEDALLRIKESMTSIFTVHDLSIAGFKKRAKQGNMAIVYHHSQNVGGSILNCLDLPGNLEPDRAVSTEKAAFIVTQGLSFCNDDRYPFPQRSTRWNLCSLKHSNTRFHIDCDGFGAVIKNLCGIKVVFFATLIGDHSVGEIDTFNSDHYNQDMPPKTHWVVEPVVLQPGSTVYIRPCRPHAVVTLEHSICEGAHIYPWSTIQESCFGIFHTFVESRFLTNTEHTWHSRELLRRIVTYYHLHFFMGVSQSSLPHHIPNLTSFPDVVRLMSLLNVVVLGHIIYPPFYDDIMVQSDPPKEYLFAIGRKKAQELLNHLSKVLNLRRCGQRLDFKPLFMTYFVQQVRCLVRHHFAASKRHSGPAGDSQACTTRALCQTIAASFSTKDWFLEELQLQKKAGHCDTTYALVSEDKYSIDTEMVEATGEEFDILFPEILSYNAQDVKMSALFEQVHYEDDHVY